MSANIMAASRVNQFALASLNAATISQEEIYRIFASVKDPNDQKAIREVTDNNIIILKRSTMTT